MTRRNPFSRHNVAAKNPGAAHSPPIPAAPGYPTKINNLVQISERMAQQALLEDWRRHREKLLSPPKPQYGALVRFFRWHLDFGWLSFFRKGG